MRECGDRMVTLGNQSPEAVRCFLDFCYSGEMVVTHENVDMLFQLASFLQVHSIRGNPYPNGTLPNALHSALFLTKALWTMVKSSALSMEEGAIWNKY